MVKLLAPVLLAIALALAAPTSAHASRPERIDDCRILSVGDSTLGAPIFVTFCPPIVSSS